MLPYMPGQTHAEALAGLLEICAGHWLRIGVLTLDRGFSTAVVSCLQKADLKWIMPCTNTPHVKDALSEFDLGDREKVFRATITRTARDEREYDMIVVPRRAKRKKKEDEEYEPWEKYIAFATNDPGVDVAEYDKRWGGRDGVQADRRHPGKDAQQPTRPAGLLHGADDDTVQHVDRPRRALPLGLRSAGAGAGDPAALRAGGDAVLSAVRTRAAQLIPESDKTAQDGRGRCALRRPSSCLRPRPGGGAAGRPARAAPGTEPDEPVFLTSPPFCPFRPRLRSEIIRPPEELLG